jgi:hypothetical protein
MNEILIWEPKYSTNSVLVATRKIGKDNYIKFTKTKAYAGTYYISGEEARKCPVVTNGRIPCFDIPMSKLELITEELKESTEAVKSLTLF